MATVVTPIGVRDACPDDAGGIVAILNPIIAARIYTALDTPVTEDEEREFIRRFPVRGIFHLAIGTADGTVLGFQSMEPFASYTHAFDHVGVLGTFVDLRRRRQGIATRLFEATFEAAVRKGYEKIFTFVRSDNAAALAAYLAHGFRTVGTAEKHAKIDGRYVDEIMIEKIL
jgi:L-amino acid N-acyltransferase YncA